MPATQWYRVEVREGPRVSHAFFWQSPDGDSIQLVTPDHNKLSFHRSLEEAIEEFRKKRQEQHNIARDGVIVKVSPPVEVTPDGPLHHLVGMLKDRIKQIEELLGQIEELLRKEIGETLYPVGHTWDWSRGPQNELVTTLRIFDRFGSVEDQFTLEEMSDSKLIERRLGRLWGDLLANRSHELMKAILESIRQHEVI